MARRRIPRPSAEDLHILDPDGEFRQRLSDDHKALASLSDSHDLRPLKVIAHRLAGAAGTFGYPELGDTATTLDEHLRVHEVMPQDVARLLAALEQALGLPGKSA
jgi:HPt (histidine-containing phosphotransfer) domain-containing protein